MREPDVLTHFRTAMADDDPAAMRPGPELPLRHLRSPDHVMGSVVVLEPDDDGRIGTDGRYHPPKSEAPARRAQCVAAMD